MKEEIVMAGFGGQGIMLMGKLLAYAGMLEGKKVTWLPSYGPEMRGGTANCTVILSTQRISSPYVTEPSSVIIMNNPSLDRFEHAVKLNGFMLLNSSMINREVKRKDIEVVKVEASAIAKDIGNVRVANMVALGGFARVKPIVTIDSLISALDKVLSTRHKDLLSLNITALKHGFEITSEDCEAVYG